MKGLTIGFLLIEGIDPPVMKFVERWIIWVDSVGSVDFVEEMLLLSVFGTYEDEEAISWRVSSLTIISPKHSRSSFFYDSEWLSFSPSTLNCDRSLRGV